MVNSDVMIYLQPLNGADDVLSVKLSDARYSPTQGSSPVGGSDPTALSVRPEQSSRSLHGWKWIVSYSAMLSTTFLFSLDNTIVANIQPSIIEDFGRIDLLPWIGTGFALGTMAVLPWGKVYGVFDIKLVYMFNIVLFEIGSAICGAAPNIYALILGRVIAGVGGSGMYSGTLTYVSVLTDLRERPAYLAGSTVVWGIGSVLGPVVGGAFAVSPATWRWGFYINLVIGAVFAPAYLLLFPRINPRPDKSLAQKCSMIDWINTAVFLGGSAILIVAISFGGVVFPFSSGPAIALFTLSGVFLVASILLMKYHPLVSYENRLYPAHFLKRFILFNMQLQVFLVSGIVLSMTYYIPLFFQFVRGDGPLEAGVRLLPLVIFLVVVSLVQGVLMPRFSYISPWYIGGSALVLAGCALMYTVHETTPNANIYGYTILVGAGAGFYIVAGFGIVQSLVSTEEIANAVGAMTISQDLGMVLFLAIAGSLFHNLAVQKVGTVLPDVAPSDIGDLIAGTSSATFQMLSDTDKAAVIPQIANALTGVWIFFLATAVLSFVFTFPLILWKKS
ncbi:major facilitator superfamily-domain-containing protein [Xylaria bambusicola]|uniref:major facilitator superfamily-domain-containing protein n=1 Tax=Xylaria bambusicola TaxID=326684 RepID=UPI002007A287|nr:major facilitator superfamily-domain-containing protein [Xylaria bambusicola]KAI0505656.1 major facilitator superfamily-domain-containing protein [Xylaria bambusicola]